MTEERDVVTTLIKHCHRGQEAAETLFRTIVTEESRSIQLPEGEVELTAEDVGEFVARYSAEVEPTLWESKRLKH